MIRLKTGQSIIWHTSQKATQNFGWLSSRKLRQILHLFYFQYKCLMIKKILNALKNKMITLYQEERKCRVFFFYKGGAFIYWCFCVIPGHCAEKVLIIGNHFTFLHVFPSVFLTDTINNKSL